MGHLNNLLKKLFITVVYFILTFSAKAQVLEGVWEGEYETLLSHGNRVYNYRPASITFRFEVVDSSYKVFSYTVLEYFARNSMIVSKVFYQRISPDEFYLEEINEGDSLNIQVSCAQKFNLQLQKRKKYTFLKGTWVSDHPGCNSSGTVWLRRKNK